MTGVKRGRSIQMEQGWRERERERVREKRGDRRVADGGKSNLPHLLVTRSSLFCVLALDK